MFSSGHSDVIFVNRPWLQYWTAGTSGPIPASYCWCIVAVTSQLNCWQKAGFFELGSEGLWHQPWNPKSGNLKQYFIQRHCFCLLCLKCFPWKAILIVGVVSSPENEQYFLKINGVERWKFLLNLLNLSFFGTRWFSMGYFLKNYDLPFVIRTEIAHWNPLNNNHQEFHGMITKGNE